MQLKAASVTIYPNGFFIYFFGPGGTARARSYFFKAGDEERLHIFFFFSGWLAAGFRVIAFLADGGRPDKQSDGGQLLLFYKEKVGVLGGAKAEPDDTKYSPFC